MAVRRDPMKGVNPMKTLEVTAVAAIALAVAGCSSGKGGGADTSSHSYQEGVKDATSYIVVSDVQGGMSETDACQAAFDMYNGAFSIDNHDQFMAGCADGLKQHPVPSYKSGFQPNP
ncbi:MAG TPA: hypothetical protein VH496_21575 [Mycobacterium sp.]